MTTRILPCAACGHDLERAVSIGVGADIRWDLPYTCGDVVAVYHGNPGDDHEGCSVNLGCENYKAEMAENQADQDQWLYEERIYEEQASEMERMEQRNEEHAMSRGW